MKTATIIGVTILLYALYACVIRPLIYKLAGIVTLKIALLGSDRSKRTTWEL